MALDTKKIPFLFSVGTKFSYKIAKRYYNNEQYVWCAQHFDSIDQPVTSNPLSIARRYIEQIRNLDRHAKEITQNKVGVLTGAEYKHKIGIINSDQYEEIKQMINLADYKDFFPILFIIDSEKVKLRCKAVDLKKRASDSSIEYLITDLKEDEYELIEFEKIFNGFIKIEDKRAGE